MSASLPQRAALALLACLLCRSVPAQSQGPEMPRTLSLERQVFSGDFDAMLQRRRIRVVVPLSRTLYFNDTGRERGVTADTVRDFETHLNRKYAKQRKKRPLTVAMIPATGAELKVGDIHLAEPNLHGGAKYMDQLMTR